MGNRRKLRSKKKPKEKKYSTDLSVKHQEKTDFCYVKPVQGVGVVGFFGDFFFGYFLWPYYSEDCICKDRID